MDDYYRLEHANPELENIMCMNWCLGNTCNFHCSYCPVGLHDGSKPWVSVDDILPFVDSLVDHYYERLGKIIYVEFTGGEVTLYKDFYKLARALKERNQWVGIISNGSRTPRFWEKTKGLIDHVCFSFHPEQGDVDHFIEVINQVGDDVDVHVNVMVKPGEDFQKSIDASDRIVNETADISFDLQTLLHDLSTIPYQYSDEEQAIIAEKVVEYKDIAKRNRVRPPRCTRGLMQKVFEDGRLETWSAGRLVGTGQNNWKGWHCAAGVEQIIVDMDGDIYRGWCRVGGRIGNVRDAHVEFPLEYVNCNKTFCHCNFDVLCTKER